MGVEIHQTTFHKQDYEKFTDRLYDNLNILKKVLNETSFGIGPRSIGAELEFYLTNNRWDISPNNELFLNNISNSQLNEEINKFNLEYNLTPVLIDNDPFLKMESEINSVLFELNEFGEKYNTKVIPIGILPTLTPTDLSEYNLTEKNRYKLLSKGLRNERGDKFQIHITGKETLNFETDYLTLEGANTSFQVHLRVNPKEFVDTYNALQYVTPLALALSANSPILFGKQLWDETRIALFKQSVDVRHNSFMNWHLPSRVSFGHGWLRESAFELFAEKVMLYPPLFPICSNDVPKLLGYGEVPELSELRLHHGTIWPWNRAIYDSNANGHLRIEIRSLPAGPTAVDMVANAAFLIGLTEGMKPMISEFLPSVPFAYAENNFYRAAQNGLDAKVIWPTKDSTYPQERDIYEVIYEILPLAEKGLCDLGISNSSIVKYLGVIERRLDKKLSGARWQRKMIKEFEKYFSRDVSLNRMVEKYAAKVFSGKELSEWDYDL